MLSPFNKSRADRESPYLKYYLQFMMVIVLAGKLIFQDLRVGAYRELMVGNNNTIMWYTRTVTNFRM